MVILGIWILITRYISIYIYKLSIWFFW
jgi:hypothetical protein